MRMTRGQVLAAGLALAAVVVVGWFATGGGPDPSPSRLWFYDLNTGKLFHGDASVQPPVAAPSGDLVGADPGTPAGVLAGVIRIEGESDPRVVFLQTVAGRASPTAAGQTLVATPPATAGDPVRWIPVAKPEGYRITMSMDAVAGGRPWKLDLPE